MDPNTVSTDEYKHFTFDVHHVHVSFTQERITDSITTSTTLLSVYFSLLISNCSHVCIYLNAMTAHLKLK